MLKLYNNLSQRTKFCVIALCFLIVTLPRFNGNQVFIKNVPYDAKYFKAYVEYFRGEAPTQPIRPASNWRLLIPFIASFLPFEPLTSLNIINLVCLALSLYILFICMRRLGVDWNNASIGITL